MRPWLSSILFFLAGTLIVLYVQTSLFTRKADPPPIMTTFKRGLSWASDNKDPTFLFTKPNSKISWLYNWSPNPTPGSSIRFVPMQWNQVDIEKLRDKIIVHGQFIPEHVLGFNEPERSDQANMSSEQAAQAWIHHIEPLRRLGIRCGSPGISSAPEGVVWLESFIANIRARGGDIDFYAIHWYGETLGQFYDYIWSTYHRLGPTKPVWITEYAPTNWNTEVGDSRSNRTFSQLILPCTFLAFYFCSIGLIYI